MSLLRCCALFALAAPRLALGAEYYFDANGSAPGAGVTDGASYAWSGTSWSPEPDGTGWVSAPPARQTYVFSAGSDGHATYMLTGDTGETGGILVQEGKVTIQRLTRVFVGDATFRTAPGTELTIANSPDFYDRAVTLDAAAGTTITLGGAASGSRRAYLTKTGAGRVVFNGANSGAAGGSVVVREGEFVLRASSSLPNGPVRVEIAGTLTFSNGIAPARAITLAGGALRALDGANTCGGTLTLTAASALISEAGASLTVNPAAGDAVTGAFPLRVSGAGGVTFSKPLAGGAALTATGPGLVTLSVPGPTAGLAVVEPAGRLRLTDASGELGGVGGAITADGLLEVANSGARTLENILHGGATGRLVKQGPGTLTLAAQSPFAGLARVEAGTLALGASARLDAASFEVAAGARLDVSAVSVFSLRAGQVLGGAGAVGGALRAESGAVLAPAPALTFEAGLALDAGAIVRVPSGPWSAGTQVLFTATAGAITGDLATVKLEGFVPGATVASLTRSPDGRTVSLVVAPNPHAARDLVWVGDGAGDRWENGGANTWRAAGQPAAFVAPDRVAFDSAGLARPQVTLVGQLAPGALTVNADGDYGFVGTGLLAGGFALVKTGAGRLVIATENTFSGGVAVNGGTVEARSGGALGVGPVTLAAGGALAFAPVAPATFANPIEGAGALRHLDGETTLAGENRFTGALTVAGGTLRLGHAAALGATSGGTWVQSGATLELSGLAVGAEPLTLQGGVLRNTPAPASWAGPVALAAESEIRADAPLVLTGALSGGGGLTKRGASRLTLAGAGTAAVPLYVAEGVLRVDGATGAGAVTVGPAGELGGAGLIGGVVTVDGRLAPGDTPTRLTIQGALTLGASSSTVLRVEPGPGATAHDVVAAPRIVMGGTLKVLLGARMPRAGESYRVLESPDLAGAFAKIELPWLVNNLIWDESALQTEGILRVIELPAVSTLEQRRRWVLTRFIDDPEALDSDFTAAVAHFARGEDAAGRARALSASRWLRDEQRADMYQPDLFHTWPAIDLVLRHGDKLDQETKDNIREVVLTFSEYKDTNTSNLKMLANVVRFLGSELYGEAAFAEVRDANGAPIPNYRTLDDPNARGHLLTVFNEYARSGFGEIASRPYFWKNLLPLLSLAQLARDPVIRQRAALTYEAGLAQTAGYWLRGHLGMPTTRSYPDLLEQYPTTSLGLLWYHFGGEVPPKNEDSAVQAAVMQPEVSPLHALAGGRRDEPFFSRSINGNYHYQAWVERDYLLFGDALNGMGSGQVYPHGVLWTDPSRSRYSHLWVTKPLKDNASEVNGTNTHGKDAGRYREAVARDALLYLFDLQPEPTDPKATGYAMGYVPGGYRAVINDAAASGQIFLHYGTVLIAIRSEIPFGWNPAGGIGFPSATPRAGDSEFLIDGDTDPARPPRVITSALRFALAVETARPAEFPGATPAAQLEAFRAVFSALPRPAVVYAPGLAADYTTRRGERLRRMFSDAPSAYPLSVNERPVNFTNYPRIENPWAEQRGVSNVLVLRSEERREILDFAAWSRSVQSAPVAVAPASPLPVLTGRARDVDLGALASAPAGSGGPLAFTLDAASGGTAVLLADGRTVRFTAGAASGPASFRYTARAPGVDPGQLLFYYDYELPEDLGDLRIADRSGQGLSGVLGGVGSPGRALTSATPPALGAASARALTFPQPDNANGARMSRVVDFADHDLDDADWTFSTWVFRASRTNDDYILYHGDGDGNGGTGVELELFFPSGQDAVRLRHFNVSNVKDLDLVSPATAPVNTWHHVALTFTRESQRSGVMRLYLNGVLVGTSGAVSPDLDQSKSLVLGGTASTLTEAWGVGRYLNGRLDETALFRRALDGAEVARLCTHTVAQFTGLVATATVALDVRTDREQWREDNWSTTQNSGEAADLADPDGDGLANLLEYALGGVPRSAASAPAPAVGVNADGRLMLTFFRAKSELTYRVEASSDLSQWTVIATNPGSVGTVVMARDTVDLGNGQTPRRFMRLRVSAE